MRCILAKTLKIFLPISLANKQIIECKALCQKGIAVVCFDAIHIRTCIGNIVSMHKRFFLFL